MKAINILAVTVFIFIFGCYEGIKPVPDAYTLNGRITFVDSNFTEQNGQYIVYAWRESIWFPLAGNPTSEQVIDIRKVNNKYVLSYDYRLAEVSSGTYVVSVQYVDSNVRKVMGIYGCNIPIDTACFQTPTKYATIVTTEGLLNIDISSHADTSQSAPQ